MTFLRNTWYVAANASELDDRLVSRRICDELIVMYRTSSGEVAALEDRCPHRFVQLSLGKRVGDRLQCGYHGLVFDARGTCVDMPNDDRAQSSRACVRSYPTVERHGLVWIWMGEAERANPEAIPDFSFITSPRFATAQGYVHMKAHYELITDNLLDLSHIHYLHPQVHAGVDFNSFRNQVKKDGDTVWSMLWRPNYPLDEQKQQLYGLHADVVDGSAHGRWNAPGVLLVFTSFWEQGKTVEEGVETPSAHLLTPETEFSTHYFFASGRTYDIDNAGLTDLMRETAKTIFETQDAPMIESEQRALGTNVNFLDQKPIILQADAAGVLARRVLRSLIRKEQDPQPSAGAGKVALVK